MRRNLVIILFFMYFLPLKAQKNRVVVYGLIASDSTVVENVNIINKNTSKGAVSDKQGKFKIAVRENDVLQFSDIQYQTIKIVIKKSHLQSRKIAVFLSENNNELREVVLENMAVGLGLPNAGKKPLSQAERKIYYIQSGGIPDKIYGWLSGDTRKAKLLLKRIQEDRKEEMNLIKIEQIRDHFSDGFFINTLKVPKDEINALIGFSLSSEMITAFDNQRYLEVINILINNRPSYEMKKKNNLTIEN